MPNTSGSMSKFKVRNFIVGETSGSHGGEYGEGSFLGYHDV
jgi:hypothetical protein